MVTQAKRIKKKHGMTTHKGFRNFIYTSLKKTFRGIALALPIPFLLDHGTALAGRDALDPLHHVLKTDMVVRILIYNIYT